MNYFDLFPIHQVNTDRYLPIGFALLDSDDFYNAESMLIKSICKELNQHGLKLAVYKDFIVGSDFNFEVYGDDLIESFATLGQLDRNAGDLIRAHGTQSDSCCYIADRFLAFSESLKLSNKDFAEKLAIQLDELNEFSQLNEEEVRDILEENHMRNGFEDVLAAALKFYKPIDTKEIVMIWNYIAYQRLSERLRRNQSAETVKQLIHDFRFPF